MPIFSLSRWCRAFGLVLLTLLFARPAGAQIIPTYTFAQSSGTYTPLVGGTTFSIFAGGGTVDDGHSLPLALPFAFPFAGATQTSVIVNSNGWLTFSNSASDLVINTVLNQAQDQMVAFFGRDLDQVNAAFSYATDGTTPNRIFKVQGSNIGQYNPAGLPFALGNVQVWLYESGRIEMHYGVFNSLFTTPSFTTTQVGLRGNGTADVRSLSGSWAAPTPGTSATASMLLNSVEYPIDGAIFAFAPPAGADLTPPVIGPITVTPAAPACVPAAHTITIQPTDASGIASARLTYTVNGGTATVLPMTNASGIWSATIPAQGTAVVTYTVSVTDGSVQANQTTSAPVSYADGAITIDAGPDQTINAGTTATLTATGGPRAALRISEFTLSSTGTGNTQPRPAYFTAGDDDFVEISNLGTLTLSLSGYQLEVRSSGAGIGRSFTFPNGTTLAAGAVAVVHIGLGTNQPSNNYYHTDAPTSTASTNPLGSGSDVGFLLLAPGAVPIDGIAVNNFPGATGLPFDVWSGAGITSGFGIAGASLTGTDANTAAGWAAATSGTPQTLGTYNPGLTPLPLPAVTWTGGTLTTPSTANPLTTPVHPAAGTFTYTVALDQNGCTVTDQVVVTVVTPALPSANFVASATSVNTTEVVTFTDLSTNLPASWLWTFAPATVQYVNGTNATSRNPQVRFTRGGCYTVTLAATNPAGSDTETKTSYVCVQLTYCNTNLQSSGCSSFSAPINSVSIAGTTLSNLNNGCSNTVGLSYSVFSASGATTATLNAGQTYALTVESASIGSIGAWLDTNANGTFETSEFILVTAVGMPPTPSTSTVSFTVPATAVGGLVGLRIRNGASANSIAAGDACVLRFTGETEDYAVTLVAACTLPAPTFSAGGRVCAGSSFTLTTAAQPVGTTYLWTGPNGFSSTLAAPTIVNATSAASGLYSLVITRGGCSSPAGTGIVTVYALPSAPVGFTVARCGPGVVRLQFMNVPAGVSYRWYTAAVGGTQVGVTGSLFTTPSLTITTTYYASKLESTCESATRTAVTAQIDPVPTATLTAAGPTTFCTGGSVLLTGAGGAPGATYTFRRGTAPISGTTGATYSATLAGTYTVVVTDPTTCTATSSAVTVTVNPQASAAFAYAGGTFCRTGTTNPRPTISGTPGGAFTATPSGLTISPTTGQVTLATSAVGTYTVTYAVSGTCPASQTQTLTISTAPAAGFAYATTGPVCAGSATTITPTLSAGASAGVFSASPAGLTLAVSSGTVNLATSQPGTYTITNTIAASGGCAAASATATLTVVAAPTATIAASGPTTFCTGGSVTLTATGGASYLWSTGATTPSISVTAAGTYTVTATNAAGCTATSAPTTVVVNPAPVAAFSYGAAGYCTADLTPAVPSVTGTIGGTFTATPSGLTINAGTGEIDLAASTPGTYQITYTLGGACPATAAQTVVLTAAPRAGFAYATASGCTGAAITLTPTPTTGATLGTLSVVPATGLTLDAATGVISLATSQPGTYTISNNVAGTGTCSAATATATVTVNPLPVLAITGLNATYCTSEAPFPLTGTVDGVAGIGTFTVDGTPATQINPGLLAVGAHTVVLAGSTGLGCVATTSQTFTISASPTQPTITVAPQPSGIVLLTSSSAVGNQWYLNGSAIPGATAAVYAVTTSTQSGTYTVVSTVGGCASAPSATQAVTVVGTAAEVAIATGFQLYPNPTTDGRVTLEIVAGTTAQPVAIFDAVGRVVFRSTVPAATNSLTLDVRALPTGVYSVRVLTVGGVAVRRLVVSR